MVSHHVGQFIAISLVIAVGLLTYVAFTMAMVNLENSLNYYYDESNFADIYVETLKVPEKGVQDVLDLPGVMHAQGRIQYDVPLKVKDENEKVTVRIESLPKDDYKINDLYFYEGRTIKNKNRDAYVFDQFAQARGMPLEGTIRPKFSEKNMNFRSRLLFPVQSMSTLWKMNSLCCQHRENLEWSLSQKNLP